MIGVLLHFLVWEGVGRMVMLIIDTVLHGRYWSSVFDRCFAGGSLYNIIHCLQDHTLPIRLSI